MVRERFDFARGMRGGRRDSACVPFSRFIYLDGIFRFLVLPGIFSRGFCAWILPACRWGARCGRGRSRMPSATMRSTDLIVPLTDRELRGQYRGTTPVAILADLPEVPAFVFAEGCRRPQSSITSTSIRPRRANRVRRLPSARAMARSLGGEPEGAAGPTRTHGFTVDAGGLYPADAGKRNRNWRVRRNGFCSQLRPNSALPEMDRKG
jgi:hypothetical protein